METIKLSSDEYASTTRTLVHLLMNVQVMQIFLTNLSLQMWHQFSKDKTLLCAVPVIPKVFLKIKAKNFLSIFTESFLHTLVVTGKYAIGFDFFNRKLKKYLNNRGFSGGWIYQRYGYCEPRFLNCKTRFIWFS